MLTTLYQKRVRAFKVVERLVYTDRRQIDLNLSQVDSSRVCAVSAPFRIVSNGLMYAQIFPQTDKVTDKIVAMLWRHYHRAVTQKHAVAFWKIEPPPEELVEVTLEFTKDELCVIDEVIREGGFWSRAEFFRAATAEGIRSYRKKNP